MEKSRLETLQEFLSVNPNDSFARYGLAQEHLRQGRLEKAREQFQELLRLNPGYAPAYYHGGQTLEKLGRLEEAREMYRQGIDLTTRSGDLHARSELQAALDLLP
ncbi:MAG: tetratricopeptide repeat protein [Acidobacteria bacterium]|nr:tetratricopeptide repeat protein [Acidobacteriota bacterium]